MAHAMTRRRAQDSTRGADVTTVPRIRAAYWVSGALALATIAAAAPTLFVPGLLRGVPVMNGSARGTALVALFVGVPVLVVSMLAVRRGAARPLISWLGAAAYLLYNAFMFLFMAPFNSLFLVYAAMLSLGVWTIATLLHEMDVPVFAGWIPCSIPARPIAAFLAAIGVLNAIGWLVQVVPALLTTKTPPFLAGTGLTTPAGWAQDLAIWIPLMLVAAIWMWQRRAWGLVIVGALLVFGVIESLGVAVDQLMGSAADPSSTVASATVTPIFGVLALVQMIPLYFYFRGWKRSSVQPV